MLADAHLRESRLRRAGGGGACGLGGGAGEGRADRRGAKIPLRFLENILGELRHAGLVQSQRGTEGGYWLTRPADEITLADVIRAVEGPLASIKSARPEEIEYHGAAKPLQRVWVALRGSIRDVLESVTVADIVTDELPDAVQDQLERPEAWEPHSPLRMGADRLGLRLRRRPASGR